MTRAARNVVRLVLVADKAAAVRASPGPADFVAAHAELLPCTAVTAGTRHWVNARLKPVLATTA